MTTSQFTFIGNAKTARFLPIDQFSRILNPLVTIPTTDDVGFPHDRYDSMRRYVAIIPLCPRIGNPSGSTYYAVVFAADNHVRLEGWSTDRESARGWMHDTYMDDVIIPDLDETDSHFALHASFANELASAVFSRKAV